MKDMRDLKAQESMFMGWGGLTDMLSDFTEHYGLSEEDIKNIWDMAPDKAHVIFAIYSIGNYEGEAFVLFIRDHKLYEVNGGHCSCFGLEGQWTPEATTLEAIEHRLVHGNLGESYMGENYRMELADLLGVTLPAQEAD